MYTFGNRPMKLFLDEIEVAKTRRPLDPDAISRLTESIKEFGLQHPISVISRDGGFRLVAGRHRLEAYRQLGLDRIETHCLEMDDRDARMWEIGENLHRADLTTEQRYEQVAEYAQLAKEKREADQSAHCGQIESKREDRRGHRSEGGDAAAARDLGLSRQQVQRAQEYAALPEEVKERAIAQGVNVTALLRERELTEARKINRITNDAVALTEAEQFAEWIMARTDLHELPQIISWLEGCKTKEVIAALRREAA